MSRSGGDSGSFVGSLLSVTCPQAVLFTGAGSSIAPAAQARSRLNSLIPLVIGAALLSFVVSYSMHLANLRMHAAAISSFQIGLSVALQGFGIFIFAQLASRSAPVIGIRGGMIVGASLCAAAMLLMDTPDTFASWAAIRIMLALGIAFLLSGSEFLVLRRCQGHDQIRIVSIYATAVAFGTTAGSFILSFLGTQTYTPFAVGAALFCLAAAPGVLWARAPERDKIDVQVSAARTVRLIPLALGAAFVFGVLDNGVLSMLPVYALQAGYDDGNALGLGLVAAAGAVAVQYPLMHFIGYKGSQFAHRFCAMAAIGTLVLLPLVLGSKAAAWLLAFAAGGFIESLYTLALIQLAQRFRNASLSSANASFISVCALGEVVGPAVTGLSMDVFGSSGMMLSAILVLATFVIFAGTKWIQVQEKRRSSRLAIEAKTWPLQTVASA